MPPSNPFPMPEFPEWGKLSRATRCVLIGGVALVLVAVVLFVLGRNSGKRASDLLSDAALAQISRPKSPRPDSAAVPPRAPSALPRRLFEFPADSKDVTGATAGSIRPVGFLDDLTESATQSNSGYRGPTPAMPPGMREGTPPGNPGQTAPARPTGPGTPFMGLPGKSSSAGVAAPTGPGIPKRRPSPAYHGPSDLEPTWNPIDAGPSVPLPQEAVPVMTPASVGGSPNQPGLLPSTGMPSGISPNAVGAPVPVVPLPSTVRPLQPAPVAPFPAPAAVPSYEGVVVPDLSGSEPIPAMPTREGVPQSPPTLDLPPNSTPLPPPQRMPPPNLGANPPPPDPVPGDLDAVPLPAPGASGDAPFGPNGQPIPPRPPQTQPKFDVTKPVPPAPANRIARPQVDLTDGRPWRLETSAMQGEVLQAPPPKLDNTPREEPSAGTERAVLLGAARNAVARGDVELGIARFEEYLRRFPVDDTVRMEYAGVLVQGKRIPQAIREYEGLLARKPGDGKLRILLADVYVFGGDFRAAVSQLTTALEYEPGNLEVATRLARVYTFDSDFVRAKQVYDRYLASIRPGDPNAPKGLAALLLDLERPGDALLFLAQFRAKDPSDLEVLAGIVRAYSRMGRREPMRELITFMKKVKRNEIGVRLALAEILYKVDDLEAAGLMYEQILELKPDFQVARVGLARVETGLYHILRARQILESFTPDADTARIYFLALAEWHQQIGEVPEAKQIYRDLLRRAPADPELHLALGALFEKPARGEYEHAKAEYAKIPPNVKPWAKRARIGFASTLARQRRFDEAIDALRAILTEDPSDAEVVALLSRTLTKAKQFDRAEALCRSYLASNPPRESMAITVRFAMGYALLKNQKWMEAARNYEVLLSRSTAQVPEAFYGLALSLERLGYVERSRDIIGMAVAPGPYELRNRMAMSDLYSEDQNDYMVLDLCGAVLRNDPYFIPSRIRMLDSQVRMAGADVNVKPGFENAFAIMRVSPANFRAHLGASRLYVIAQDFNRAVQQYDRVIGLDPEFYLATVEKARTQYNNKQFAAARGTYQSLMFPSPDEVLIHSLSELAANDLKLRPVIEPYLHAKASGDRLRTEMARVAGALPPDQRDTLLRSLHDYDAEVAVDHVVRLEFNGKEVKDYKREAAVAAFRQSVVEDLDNVETRFDLGQAHAVLQQTRAAIMAYSDTLNVEPANHGALVAIDRASAELKPQWHNRWELYYQDGRSGLANITRNTLKTWARIPYGDENEFLDVGYASAFYSPVADSLLYGNIPFIRVQKMITEHTLAYAQLNIEQFAERFTTRPTFDIGFSDRFNDCVTLRGNAFLENVAENGESMRQDIYRYGFNVGANYRISKLWNTDANIGYVRYSDNNSLIQADASSDVSLTLPPKQLRLISSIMYQGYSDTTVLAFDPANPARLDGTVHPYFAPSSFVSTMTRLEWKHWLSRDYFAHSNQCWYLLSYGLAIDSSQVFYQDLRAAFNYDYCSWLTLGMETRGFYSRDYDQIGLMAYLIIRFQ
ncbi:hypothetical protein : Uncharacterized protein OS=Blastopirellula marina DSM 3645 GN=DSM3645_10232 PE=4 SV=1: TPR_16 [Tuwongella immobilis]|uniref:Tetratricopeptide repeat protein n=2 Tax=Tuwongella immobilis TaxID=692036 RepID=A0A6C2YUT6_9BACT|nr:hypothetical protein : Uncharacterized protein OS=Blastopirellula marina DSM 3645 GN=DSM3645_10232 PE=4 SV=1: TPR_16 [Tuwongella immobilis]VTS08352.1 hypothetical protein : Uncharacterized protein OS=Blastopirellula marina DSM 3645 GN=DSM3645_10232 PE=4 SV=1: TPR_16 [Tuwongella immobilis]